MLSGEIALKNNHYYYYFPFVNIVQITTFGQKFVILLLPIFFTWLLLLYLLILDVYDIPCVFGTSYLYFWCSLLNNNKGYLYVLFLQNT